MRVDSHTHDGQAMRVLIHTHISYRLLVEGSAPKPLLNTGFHSVATRSPNASEGASRLLEEHQVRYENKTKHAGRRIRLTYMMVEAPAFEVIE